MIPFLNASRKFHSCHRVVSVTNKPWPDAVLFIALPYRTVRLKQARFMEHAITSD